MNLRIYFDIQKFCIESDYPSTNSQVKNINTVIKKKKDEL